MDRLRSSVLRTPPTLWLGAAILIVAAIAAYSYLDSQAFRRAAGQSESLRLAVEDNRHLLSLLKDAETAQRGYLLTGDSHYLAPYDRAQPEILGRLRTLALSASSEERRLATLLSSELAELAQTIRVRQQGDLAAVLEVVRSDRGKDTMDQIRQLAERIIAKDDEQFRARNASALRLSQDRLILDLQLTREREAHGRAALSTTLRSIGDAVIATGSDSRIYFMNPIAEALTGWTGPDAEGRPLSQVFRIQEEHSGQPAEDITIMVLRDNI